MAKNGATDGLHTPQQPRYASICIGNKRSYSSLTTW